MQAQQALALPRRSFSTAVAIVATVVAAALALALVFSVEGPATSSTPTVVTLHSVGAEQIAHNRSEEGLGGTGSVGSPDSDLTGALPSAAFSDQTAYSANPDLCVRNVRQPMAC